MKIDVMGGIFGADPDDQILRGHRGNMNKTNYSETCILVGSCDLKDNPTIGSDKKLNRNFHKFYFLILFHYFC